MQLLLTSLLSHNFLLGAQNLVFWADEFKLAKIFLLSEECIS